MRHRFYSTKKQVPIQISPPRYLFFVFLLSLLCSFGFPLLIRSVYFHLSLSSTF
ncbi:hypothetical protein CLOBOL_00057 [Enterocloster bolteae ATCC BAA-613]|uniref:Uncharacterized protein n=1 Tax=Enterocloster bolteae (strain ATCC BAA-613 / DSM 15670 / CCUG 46953 / JCM 12243 / WAL 16351) TaxID=411902 RepID=A8RG66_ENTBW|nr:hypothetical protein CLOBOL_00057 [Enterocloster bolteae ATCC BAA-613]